MIALVSMAHRINSYVAKLKFAIAVLFRPMPSPNKIQLSHSIILDLDTGRIILHGDTELHCDGNLHIRADKHLMLSSGQDVDPERPAYIHSIWFNTAVNQKGLPIRAGDSGDK